MAVDVRAVDVMAVNVVVVVVVVATRWSVLRIENIASSLSAAEAL
jgi:hypothetical protein